MLRNTSEVTQGCQENLLFGDIGDYIVFYNDGS